MTAADSPGTTSLAAEVAAALAGVRSPVVVACSGGADSIALLVLAVDAGLEPIAVHVDHGLRPDSARDAAVVAEAAGRLGVPWRTVRVAVGAGPNLEARAREARYAALRVAAAESDAAAILVAHTADDQAETVLLNVLRGAAGSGLSGMAPRRGDIVRPLLGRRRAEVRAVAAARGFCTVDDPTNADTQWRRAWIRHEVLPMLGDGAARDLVPVLARQADVLRSESEFLDELADALLIEAGRVEPKVAVLAAAPVAVRRRAVRRWLGSPPASQAEVDRVLAVVDGVHVATELSGRRRVARSGGRLRVADDAPLP